MPSRPAAGTVMIYPDDEGGNVRQASRRAQLQRLLGALGEVHEYVSSSDDTHPAPGWYATPSKGCKPPASVWKLPDGSLYMGHDSTQAAFTIAGLLNA